MVTPSRMTIGKAVEGLDAELPKGRLAQEFPYQIAFPTARCAPSRDDLLIQMFCDHRNVTPRHHTVRRDDKDFIVYCFADAQHAESFQAAFGGEPFTLRSAGAAHARYKMKSF